MKNLDPFLAYLLVVAMVWAVIMLVFGLIGFMF